MFRNFEEIYGQKVVTALSKVTKMGSTIGLATLEIMVGRGF